MPKPKKPKKGAPAWMVARVAITYPIRLINGVTLFNVANGEA